MTNPFDHSAELNQFTGMCPLFPLPEVVLFPHVLLPLHIFEPRYRQMTEDALRGYRFMALAMLQPDADPALVHAPIHDSVCLGRITAEERASLRQAVDQYVIHECHAMNPPCTVHCVRMIMLY